MFTVMAPVNLTPYVWKPATEVQKAFCNLITVKINNTGRFKIHVQVTTLHVYSHSAVSFSTQ